MYITLISSFGAQALIKVNTLNGPAVITMDRAQYAELQYIVLSPDVSYEAKNETISIKNEVDSMSAIGASVVTSLGSQVSVGILLSQTVSKAKSTTASGNFSLENGIESTSQYTSLFLGYDLPKASLTMSFENNSDKSSYTSDDSPPIDSISYTRTGLDFIYKHSDILSLGVNWAAPVRIEEDSNSIVLARTLALYTIYKISNNSSFGLKIESIAESQYSDDAEDYTPITIMFEGRVTEKFVGSANVTYKEANNSNDEGISASTLSSVTLELSGEYQVHESVDLSFALAQVISEKVSKTTQGVEVNVRNDFTGYLLSIAYNF